MLDEFHRASFKVKALRAEGQTETGRENGRMVRGERVVQGQI